MDVNLDANLALLQRGASIAQVRAAGRAGGGHRLEERARAGAGRGGVLGLQGGLDPAGARGGAGVGRATASGSTSCTRTRSSTPASGPTRSCARAPRSYGLSVEEYKKNNVLGVEITSRDVAELVAEMCGPLFARTTGAQVPIDGGNDRVI